MWLAVLFAIGCLSGMLIFGLFLLAYHCKLFWWRIP